MTDLLKRVKKKVHQKKNKIESCLMYSLIKEKINHKKLRKQFDRSKRANLIQERKYIDKINIQKYEIRYIDLQMARVKKYINSARFKNDTNETIREHLIELIEGKVQD